jgi:cobalt/nickel transport system ATP-binding protein
MIELDNLGFAWPGNGPPVLTDLTLHVAPGEKLVLLGANGCGKSTLLKLLNGLVFASAGLYRFKGREVSRGTFRDRTWSRGFRSAQGLLFQHPEAMLFNPTVREEIGYGPRRLGLEDTESRVRRWARELRLEPLLDQPPYALSGGEKQKVALAAVLAIEPDCLLLDEPVSNLDPRSTGWLVDHLLDTQAAVLVSTHNLSMAAELGTRCLVLDETGRLLFDGPVTDALGDLDLLERANLVHRHRHRHGTVLHAHLHVHDWG